MRSICSPWATDSAMASMPAWMPSSIDSRSQRRISRFCTRIACGVASTIDIEQLRSAADQSQTFRGALARHGLAVYAQIQQTAGCNASHTVESRLARCLLHTHDLSGSDKLVLTQEAMAQMIGARRNSVSLVASTLQQAKFIHYSRGHIEIVNLDGLIKTSCECYATVKAQYTRLLQPRIHCTA